MRMGYQNLSLLWCFLLFCGETMSRVFGSCCSIGRHYLPACYKSLNKQEVCLINVVNLFLQHAEEINKESQRKSVQRLTCWIGISTRTALKMCRHHLSFPCKIQLGQPMSLDGITKIHASAKEYGDLLGAVRVSWMSCGSPTKQASTWMIALKAKCQNLGVGESKVYCCQPTASRGSFGVTNTFPQVWLNNPWKLHTNVFNKN
jgi:hypothetical protein